MIKNYLPRITLLFAIYLIFCPHLFGLALPVVLNEEKGIYSLENYLEYYIDDSKTLKVTNVSDPTFIQNFKPYDKDLIVSKNDIALWVTFKVINPLNSNQLLFLSTGLPNPYKSWLLYQKNNYNQFEIINTIKPWHILLYPLDIPKSSEETFYLSYTTERNILSDLKLFKPEIFAIRVVDQYIVYGIHFGIPVSLLLYTILMIIFVHQQNKIYIPYVCFIIAYLIGFSLIYGFINRIPGIAITSWWYTHIFRLTIAFLAFFSVLFAKRLLIAHKYAPKLNRIMIIYLFLCLFFILLIILPLPYQFFRIVSILLSIYLVSGNILGLSVSFFAIKKKYQPAKYYFLGSSSLIVGYTIFIFAEQGLLPLNVITIQAPQYGLDIEIIFQMIALAVLFNLVRDSEVNAQRKLIKQKESNEKIQAAALREQKNLVKSYARFFPHQFLKILNTDSVRKISLGDEVNKQNSILFGDLRNFTANLENKNLEESFEFINNYLGKIGPVVRQHNGFINKYIGDAILAIFDSADQALKAALDIIKILQTNNNEVFKMGLGLHQGEVEIGMIGEAQRMDGAVIGLPVTTAIFIENLNKFYNTNIIVTENIILDVKNEFDFRYLDRIKISEKIILNLYEVYTNDLNDIKEKKSAIASLYHSAILAYQQGHFDQALQGFISCNKILTGDRVLEIYIERCSELVKHKKPIDWRAISVPCFHKTLEPIIEEKKINR